MHWTICCLDVDNIERLSAVTLHGVMDGDLVCTRPSAASTLTSKDYRQPQCTVWCTGILYVPDDLLSQYWHQNIISSHTTLCDVRGSCMYQTLCCLNIDNIKRLSTVTLHCVMYGDLVCTRPSVPQHWQHQKIINSHTTLCDVRGSCMYQTICASTLTTSKDYQQSHCTVWCTGILYVPDHLCLNIDNIKRLSTVTLRCVMYGDLVCTRPSVPQHWQHQKIINSHTTLCDVRGSCMYQTIYCLNIDIIKRLSTVTLHCVMYGDLVARVR